MLKKTIRIEITRRSGEIVAVESGHPILVRSHRKLIGSGRVVRFAPTDWVPVRMSQDFKSVLIRPYYRKMVDGTLTIFAEEER